jgi:hypothetical protein
MRRLFFFLLTTLLTAGDLPAQLPYGYPIDIYLLAGQSNMSGRGTPAFQDSSAHPRVFALDALGRVVPATEPLHWDRPTAGVGPGLAFGKAMAAADTNRVILLVPAAVGGTRIEQWRPGGYDPVSQTQPYDEALSRVAAARERGGEIRGILWHQGESNSRMDLVGGYRNKLIELVGRFRQDLGIDTLAFVAGELLPNGQLGRPAELINQAIRGGRGFISDYRVVAADPPDHQGDFIHFDADTARRLGQAYAEAMLQLIGQEEATPLPPKTPGLRK